MAYGMKGHVMVNFQNSYGTSDTSSLNAVPVISEGLVLSIDPLVETNMYSRFQESPYHEGQHLVQGDLNMEAHPTAMGFFLKSAFGQVTTTSDTGIQTHVFETKATDFDDRAALVPMTAEVFRDVGSAYLYSDLMANNLTLNISNSELLSMTVGFLGSTMSRKAASTPTYETAKPFLWSQTSVSINGVGVCEVSDFSFSLNNNLEAQYTLCDTKSPHRIIRTGMQTVELSGTFRFNAQSYHQSFENQDEIPVVIHFSSDQAPHLLTLDIPLFRWKTFEPTMGGAGIIDAPFTAQAIYSTTSQTAARITLANTQTYY